MRYVSTLALSLLLCSSALSHPGGLDANGGHFNRKTGGYHYHGGGTRSAPSAPATPRTSPRTEVRSEPRTKARAISETPDQDTVYVTKTGSKYHSAGCRHLRRSSIPMPLEEAAARYSPCSACDPPTLARTPESSIDDSEEPSAADGNDKVPRVDPRAGNQIDAADPPLAEDPESHKKSAAERERRAADKLRLAKKLRRTDREAGTRWLNDVVREYPGTAAAKEAENMLNGR